MAHTTSCSGQRCWAIVFALAALASGAWFLPEMPGRAIQTIDFSPSSLFGSAENHLTVFHSADELEQALRPDAGSQLPGVDWNVSDVVRVRCAALGYMCEGDTQPRYGTLEHDSRWGGLKLYVYLHEPLTSRSWEFGTTVNSVFSQMFREAWFVVPKGARLEWGSAGMRLGDWTFGALTALLLFALVLVVCRRPRFVRNVSVDVRPERAAVPSD